MIPDKSFRQVIQLKRGHSRFDYTGNMGKSFAYQQTAFPDQFNFRTGFIVYHVSKKIPGKGSPLPGVILVSVYLIKW